MYNNNNNFTINLLINLKFHLGSNKSLNDIRMNSYIFAEQHKISIFNIEKIFLNLKYLKYNLKKMFQESNSIFISSTNSKIFLNSYLNEIIENKYNENLKVVGFLEENWIYGALSNWRSLILQVKKLKRKKNKSKKIEIFLELIKNRRDSFFLPDFIFLINQDKKALNELLRLRIPILGLIDSKDNPHFNNYNLIGNNESLETIEFIFYLLLLNAFKENLFDEQKIFYKTLLLKIKNIIKKKIF